MSTLSTHSYNVLKTFKNKFVASFWKSYIAFRGPLIRYMPSFASSGPQIAQALEKIING